MSLLRWYQNRRTEWLPPGRVRAERRRERSHRVLARPRDLKVYVCSGCPARDAGILEDHERAVLDSTWYLPAVQRKRHAGYYRFLLFSIRRKRNACRLQIQS